VGSSSIEEALRASRVDGFLRRNRIRIAVAACAVIAPAVAVAELSNDSLIGPGLRSRPAYDGSASQRTELVPAIRYLGSPWFVRSTQGVLEGGLRVELAPGLHAAAQLAYEPGRTTSESSFLESHAVAGIKRGASVGLQMEWDHSFGPVPITLLARVRKHTEADLGAQADLRLSVGVFQSGPVSAGVFTQATWANARSMGALYGVTAQQSAATGLPAFAAGGGNPFASVGLLWSVDLSPRWVVVGSLEARRLHGDAASSPLTERVSNHWVSAGVAYRF
jgi:outer membrane scaffolding protein for murein synthesis (MipA/OmpV family)